MAEVPLLKQLYWKYQDRGLSLIGVSLDEDKAAAQRAVAEKGMFWPVLSDGKADQGEIPKLYNVTGTPVLYVIDRAGAIAARLEGASRLDQQLFETTAPDSFPTPTDRDTWQRPVRVMEELHLRSAGAVADVGAGGGYFTFRLAARVGPKGKVYAQDVDEKALARIRERAQNEKLAQVEIVQASQDDPKLPGSLDAILIVDAFHEFSQPDAMVAGFFRALKPGGHLGVLDWSAALGLKSAEYMESHRLPQEMLIERLMRAGLRLVSFDSDFCGPPDGIRSYFAVFEKPH